MAVLSIQCREDICVPVQTPGPFRNWWLYRLYSIDSASILPLSSRVTHIANNGEAIYARDRSWLSLRGGSDRDSELTAMAGS